MTKRILMVAMLAAAFSGPGMASAEAGPLRDKVKRAAGFAKSGVFTVAKTGALLTRCTLKGKRGQIIC